jgi:hypothetical protein
MEIVIEESLWLKGSGWEEDLQETSKRERDFEATFSPPPFPPPRAVCTVYQRADPPCWSYCCRDKPTRQRAGFSLYTQAAAGNTSW